MKWVFLSFLLLPSDNHVRRMWIEVANCDELPRIVQAFEHRGLTPVVAVCLSDARVTGGGDVEAVADPDEAGEVKP